MKKRKSINTDFLLSDLPKNRYELFWDILKNQWRSVVIISLLLLVIFLPLIMFRYYNLLTLNNLLTSSEKLDNDKIINSQIGYYSLSIIVFLLMGICFGGIARLYKKMSF